MEEINIDALLNQTKNQKINNQLKRENISLRIILSLIIILGMITLVFPDIWNILLSFAIVLAFIGFIPFTVWLLLFSKYDTCFDRYYDREKER